MRVVKKEREEEIKVIPPFSFYGNAKRVTPWLENCIVETSWRKDLYLYSLLYVVILLYHIA